ncbi:MULTISPECIES: Na+/H+ antiporter subunit D [unclassified Leucobacter]|uniref:Na+/H+ antiporter subunit D n=1 Tax=unclassified Leucobacter TaxID=2621730 RepID=UPI002041B9B9|nr:MULTISPECIES: Na+/H+ antiporter subunit D [unclassified Leucobacter]
MTLTPLIPLVVLVPLAAAAITLSFPGRRRLQQGITVAALATIVVLGGILMWASDTQGTLVMEVGGWAAPYGIALVVDRVSALMVTVSAVVLLGVLLFSLGQGLADGDEETPVSIYYPTYLVLGAGVCNAFIAGDLFNLYVGFEILLVASYVLITLGGTVQRIRAGVTYVVVSLVSSILFLGAIALIYGATGTVNMAQLTIRIAELPDSVQLLLNLTLLIAFGIKAAVFPLAFWLPDSYPTAPAPVTAVFAGLLTKVGVYAIIRTQTLLFPLSSVDNLLLVIAGCTLLVGILGAVSQLDIKRILSFTLISHIGYMIFGIGMASVLGFSATIFYIAHHIIVQTTLFLAVGLMERHGGTTSLTGLGGMLRSAPVIAVLFFIPMLNLGGIPPFSGFIGKLGLFTAGAELATPGAYWLIGIGAAVSLLTLYALTRAWSLAFWRPRDQAAASGLEVNSSSDTTAPGVNGGTGADLRTAGVDLTGAEFPMVNIDAAASLGGAASPARSEEQSTAGVTAGARTVEAAAAEAAATPAVEPAAAPTVAPSAGAELRRREVDQLVRLHDAPDAQPRRAKRDIPRLMTGATAGMVGVSIALTIFAGPLYAYASRAGEDLANPARLVQLVLGDTRDGLGGGSGTTELEPPESRLHPDFGKRPNTDDAEESTEVAP